MKRFKKGFTLAEVLITLAIIGVVAAIAIPSVISNTQQQEFKTGLKKAVSVLNSAITMNMAIDGESPYDNKDLFNYLQRHMSVISTTSRLPFEVYTQSASGSFHGGNSAFYTTDGMRFEFNAANKLNEGKNKLHESDTYACTSVSSPSTHPEVILCNGCGSYGLNHNPNGTTEPPCLILVDVNGDKKPTPTNINCRDVNCAQKDNVYKVPLPAEKKVRDIFSILITDEKAIPYGVTAQKAMYQAQK